MIVVTGSTGLLGSHLLYKLTSEGKNVRALIRQNSNINAVRNTFSYYTQDIEPLLKRIEWFEADVLDKGSLIDALNGATQVYHTAAFVSFVPAFKQTLLSTNITGTANLVDACLLNNVKKLCHVSSVAALGTSPDGIPSNENMIWNPGKKRSWYSVSKFHSEMEVWRAIEEGLNAIIINPSIIIGPGNWERSSAALFSTIYNGLKFYPPGSTGYVDVRDVTNAMVKLMECEITNERFIINAGEMSFKEVFKQIADSVNKPAPSIKVTKWMAALGWKIEKLKSIILGKHPKITKETVASGFHNSAFDSSKLIEKLNFQYIPIEKSIQDTGKLFLQDLKKQS